MSELLKAIKKEIEVKEKEILTIQENFKTTKKELNQLWKTFKKFGGSNEELEEEENNV